MYNQPIYTPQASIDRINNQIAELEKMKSQIPQAPVQQPITQNFQLAPTPTTIRYADNIEEVEKCFVLGDTPFFSKDMSILWIKNSKNEIKVYSLEEIIQKDEKDLLIESLQLQINEMKGMVNNEKSNVKYDDEPIENKKSTNGKSSTRNDKK